MRAPVPGTAISCTVCACNNIGSGCAAAPAIWPPHNLAPYNLTPCMRSAVRSTLNKSANSAGDGSQKIGSWKPWLLATTENRTCRSVVSDQINWNMQTARVFWVVRGMTEADHREADFRQAALAFPDG